MRSQVEIIKENFTMEIKSSVESDPPHATNINLIKDTSPIVLRVFGV